MLKNYLKTAWRNVQRNKGFFALNFIGLYVSVVSCILIALIILHEISFDQPTAGGPHTYRIVVETSGPTGKTYGGATQYPLATALRAALPGGPLISQIHYEGHNVVSTGDKKFIEYNIIFADSVFPRLFPMKVRSGSLRRALSEPGFVVLTETSAHRYFGDQDPVGRRMRIANLVDCQVAAVVADPPSNTHLSYNMLVSYLSMNKHLVGDWPIDSWQITAAGYTYVGLSDPNRTHQVEAALAGIAKDHVNTTGSGNKGTYKLQPVQDIHFDQTYASSNPGYTINYRYLYLIGAIGLFLMLAACINYTNLSTALAIRKSKEVGVRKTMGATRIQLMKQFFSETFFLTGAVILLAAGTISFLLPSLNTFLDKNIPLQWLTPGTALLLIGLWVVISGLSGLYPAIVLSGFNPITALKNKISAPKPSVLLMRRGLVVFQFLTAQILIIGAIVVTRQMLYIQNRPLGFNKDKVLDLDMPDNSPAKQRTLFERLSAVPGISSISLSLGAPVSNNSINTNYNLQEKIKTTPLQAHIKAVDKAYLQTYGLQLVAGRWFDESDERRVAPTVPDSLRRYSIILNETAVRQMGFASPQEALGKYVNYGLNKLASPVIGVMKDYNIASLHEAVSPVLMIEFPDYYYNVGIKFAGDYSMTTLSAIDKAWSSVFPQEVFETHFLDARVADQYKDEQRTQRLFFIFTFLSISINVLGLIGLLSFMIEQKTKEIGIRKVLGAGIKDISFILSKDFLRLILLAFLIAAPIAGYLMHQWLDDFAYRTDLNWWMFALAILATLIVTILAVGYQTMRAALANPIKSLRSE